MYENKKENIVKTKTSNEFIKLNQLKLKKEGVLLNVIGVVVSVDEIREITPKFKSPINLKNFYICDQTSEVKVSLWGKQAEHFCIKKGDIYMLNKVKLVNYNGSLGVSVLLESHITKIEENFDIDEADELKKWWLEKTKTRN